MVRRNPLFQDLDGLIHKSYFYEEDEGIYAPFYVWHDDEPARKFLLDGLFDGVANEFGRPRVRTWQVLRFGHGDRSRRPTYACCEIDQVSQGERLSQILIHESELHEEALERPGLFAHTVALDPDRWEVRRISIWDNARSASVCSADCVRSYRVLGVYEPADMPTESPR